MLFSKKKIFVIAEMANSHEGILDNAKKIVKAAAEAGADAVKFQKFFADELAQPNHEYYTLYKKLEMKNNEWKELILYAKSKNLKVFVDVFGIKSTKQISKIGVDGYKIHASDVNNHELLRFLDLQKKPILLSVAGCLSNEIYEALQLFHHNSKSIVLMHGFQGYPTKIHDMNINRITELKKQYGKIVGLMDHLSGNSEMALTIPLLGISMGARVIEKHLTLDRSKKGLDYYSALNPSEFKKFVLYVRSSELAFGDGKIILSKNETKYRLDHKKNIVAKYLIKNNTKISEKMFEFKRTKTKQEPLSFHKFLGKYTSKIIHKGDILNPSMVKGESSKIAAVIACRVGSERLFAKPLQLIGNFTILELLLNQIRKSTLIDEIVLAISNKPGNEIFITFAKENNIPFIEGDDIDVLQRLIDGAKYVNADIIFRVTPDQVFIHWEKIDKLLRNHIQGKFSFSILNDVPIGAGYEIINLSALEASHSKGHKKHQSELASLYIYEHKNKFKINEVKPEKILQRSDLRLTVDFPEDLQMVRLIDKSIGNNGKPIPLKKIITFLDKNPEIAKINSHIPIGKARLW